MMGTLYFLASTGERRKVKENIEEDYVKIRKEIINYIFKLNSKFKIYYCRYWSISPGITRYDVGSHTEFFEWVKEEKT